MGCAGLTNLQLAFALSGAFQVNGIPAVYGEYAELVSFAERLGILAEAPPHS